MQLLRQGLSQPLVGSRATVAVGIALSLTVGGGARAIPPDSSVGSPHVASLELASNDEESDRLVLSEAPTGVWDMSVYVRSGNGLTHIRQSVEESSTGIYAFPVNSIAGALVADGSRWSDVTIVVESPASDNEPLTRWTAGHFVAILKGGAVQMSTHSEAASDPAYWRAPESMPGLSHHLAHLGGVVRILPEKEGPIDVLPDEDPALAPQSESTPVENSP